MLREKLREFWEELFYREELEKGTKVEVKASFLGGFPNRKSKGKIVEKVSINPFTKVKETIYFIEIEDKSVRWFKRKDIVRIL